MLRELDPEHLLSVCKAAAGVVLLLPWALYLYADRQLDNKRARKGRAVGSSVVAILTAS